jgi:hypothetical protein
MANRSLTIAATLVSLVFGTSHLAHAEGTKTPLEEIMEAADRLCVDVAHSGNKSSAELRGNVKAELSGLAKKLVDLSGDVNGKIDTQQYEGVIQEQLAEMLKDVRSCKIQILNTLQQKMLTQAPQQAPRDPDGLYQYGEKVAEIQGAVAATSS